MIFLQHLTLFLNSHIRMLPQFLQWFSSSLSSSSAFPLNVFARQVFSVVILSLLVLSGWSPPRVHAFIYYLYTASHCHISISPVPSSPSRRYFRLEIFAIFLLSSSVSLSCAHPTFPGHLVSHWAWLQNICSFFIVSYLCHLIYLSLLSSHSLLVSLPCCSWVNIFK